jgi:hypothetical protein
MHRSLGNAKPWRSHMSSDIPDDQLAVLRDISEGKRITGDRANWVVVNGYAQQAEDADIDITDKGRAALEQNRRS